MEPTSELRRVIDFILNQANDQELDLLQGAIARRTGARGPGHTSDLNFKDMASKITEAMGQRFAVPGTDQVRSMTRNMVGNIIRTHEPNIPAEHLEELLDRYVPDPTRGTPGKEQHIPEQALRHMVRQFVSYGQGRMPKAEELELKREMPDWSEKYWRMFSSATQTLIRELLTERISAAEFETSLSALIKQRGK